MFKRFFEKLAAKASLANIGYDLKRLDEALPHNPSVASKAIFTLLENVTLAFANGAEESHITRVFAERLQKGKPSFDIAVAIFALVRCQRGKNAAGVEKCDADILRVFAQTTGVPLDPSQIPWMTKRALATEVVRATPAVPPPEAAKPANDAEVAKAFSNMVLEQLNSGEILTTFDLLKKKPNAQLKGFLVDELRRKKKAFEVLSKYGALSEENQRMARLVEHILGNEKA